MLCVCCMDEKKRRLWLVEKGITDLYLPNNSMMNLSTSAHRIWLSCLQSSVFPLQDLAPTDWVEKFVWPTLVRTTCLLGFPTEQKFPNLPFTHNITVFKIPESCSPNICVQKLLYSPSLHLLIHWEIQSEFLKYCLHYKNNRTITHP